MICFIHSCFVILFNNNYLVLYYYSSFQEKLSKNKPAYFNIECTMRRTELLIYITTFTCRIK